ncbi:MAG: rod shape-determining protein [Kitasatospora sp.]|nr:rod shape-determining protein [Kitasatospora sp.]
MQLRAGVAIDLGTVNTLVWVRGRGLVVEEPSAIAVDTVMGRALAAGEKAELLAGKEPRGVEVIHPLRDGVITDLGAATAMLQAFFDRARLRRGLLRSSAVVCVPSDATAVESQALASAVQTRRPHCSVRVVEEPVAAAAGAGLDLSGGEGVFVVDVGGGTTEIAVVTGGRLVRAESLRLAGNAMDEAVAQAVKAELGLLIGPKAAKRLKIALGLTGGTTERAETIGVDIKLRTPRAELVPGALVARALEPAVAKIADSVREILLDLPPDLAEDIVREKVCLAGGGALLPVLADRIEVAAGIPALVVDDPLRCVVRGAAEILEGRGGLAA